MVKLVNFSRRFKIKNKIAVCLITGLIAFLLIILAVSRFFSQWIIKEYLYGYVESVQEEIVSSIEMVVNEVNMLAVRLQTNRNIYSLFDDKTLSVEKREEKLNEIINEMSIQRDAIGDIVIIDFNNNVYNCNLDGYAKQMPDNLFIEKIKGSQIPVWGEIKKASNNKAYIPMGMNCRNFYTGQKIGYLIIYIRENALYNIYKSMASQWGYSFILADGNYIISHPDNNQIGKVMFELMNLKSENIFDYRVLQNGNQSVLVATHKFSEYMKGLGSNWEIVSVLTYNSLFDLILKINKYLIFLGFIVFLISVSVSILVSTKITRPVAALKNKLKEFGNGNLDMVLYTDKGDEIWELEKSFNLMVVQIKELLNKNNEEKEKQREMELVALQAQINPHFLYNTLDAIGWIAKLKKQDDIEKLVMALARFFRLSLHKGDKFITVYEEIQLVQSFVTIEQMRMPDKFNIEYYVPEEIKNYKILKIILQPIVENAIKHGIAGKREKGNIFIRAELADDKLIFTIIDDGEGFDVAATDFSETYNNFRHSGYGLKNVEERIKLEYGRDSGISIESEIGKGSTVTMYLQINEKMFS